MADDPDCRAIEREPGVSHRTEHSGVKAAAAGKLAEAHRAERSSSAWC